MVRFGPFNVEAAIVADIYFASHDRNRETVSVADPNQLFLLRKALDIVNRNTSSHVTIIIRAPVFQEVTDVFDIDASTWDLPKSCMGWLTASTWFALVTGLLEELAS